MRKYILTIFVFLLVNTSFGQLVINEINLGAAQDQYIELVVTGTKTCSDSTVNIQSWVIDDHNGFFGLDGISGGHFRFSNDPQWASLSPGTIIVIYNVLAPFQGIVNDQSDANNDNVYILASNSPLLESHLTLPTTGNAITSYTTTGYSAGGNLWDFVSLDNTSDAFHVVDPASLNTSAHSIGWGNITSTNIAFAGNATNLLFQNENTNNNDPFAQANWSSSANTNGSPGLGNNAANAAWINAMLSAPAPVATFDTINQLICHVDSFLFNSNYYNIAGSYTDTLPSTTLCDSIVTLNLALEVCSSCELDLGNDTTICGNINHILDAGDGFDDFLWQDGSTNQTFNVTAPGQYFCEVTSSDTTNLIVNPSFESGNVNFITDYSLGNGGTFGLLSNAGTYAITTSPDLVHNFFQPCIDQTTGTGNMMVVNGSNLANQAVWCQTINVDPNTDYFFAIWATSLENINAFNAASLFFEINGVQIGPNFNPTLSLCDWQQYRVTWNSGTSMTAQLCIFNHTISGKNDFAIDDIFFGELCTTSDTINILGATDEQINRDTLICFGDSIFVGNAWQNTAGTYTDTLNLVTGCTSVRTTNLQIANAPITDTTITCTNNMADAGIFIANTLLNFAGCDSVFEISRVQYIQRDTLFLPDSCSAIAGDEQTIYTDFNSTLGCDSFTVAQRVVYIELTQEDLPLIEICEGESVVIFGNNESVSGIYSELIQSQNGCDSLMRVQELIVNSSPVVEAGDDVTITSGEELTLNAIGNDTLTYIWSNGFNTQSIVVAPQSTTDYFVTVEDLNSCTATDTILVTVNQISVDLLLPTAFSPNNDGINDIFRIVNQEDFEEIAINIYNRWGEKVFNSSADELGWNGIYKGVEQPIDNYVYFIEARAKTNGEQFKLSGSFSLIR